MVRAGITDAAALRGKTLATPQLGGTQDVALRTWLAAQGLKTDLRGGEVSITPTENAQTLELFRAGAIDGAWLPEPWASRLVLEAGATVLVDEADLWDGAETGAPGCSRPRCSRCPRTSPTATPTPSTPCCAGTWPRSTGSTPPSVPRCSTR